VNIDNTAPLTARKEIIINASIERVWKIQTDIENWPTWQKDISSATLHSPLTKGTIFTWKAMGMDITSELVKVAENQVFYN